VLLSGTNLADRQLVAALAGALIPGIANLSPDGLMAFLVSQDEALLRDSANRAQKLPSQLACFGPESIPAHDLRTKESKNIQAAVASRFLIEYTAATPPTGSTRINLMIYEELLAVAAELIARATLSDAIHYGFSQVELSLLPSGRLGVSLGDRYVAGTEATAAAEAEARHALALGPAPASGATQPMAGTEQQSTDAARRARVDDAMQAYRDGQEDQLGSLGLVLNATVLWTTRYMDAAVSHLRENAPGGQAVLDEDVARLSPLKHANLNFLGRYSFRPSQPSQGLRPLRDPSTPEPDEDAEDGTV
jgi:Tn3 transposase DDE domain